MINSIRGDNQVCCRNHLICSFFKFSGELIPLRAFGDIRYKMPAKVLRSIAELCGLPPSYPVTPRFYSSPPYLFATPQIACRRLDPRRDRFVILASDGLWDMLTPHQAVCVVAQHYLDYHGVRWVAFFLALSHSAISSPSLHLIESLPSWLSRHRGKSIDSDSSGRTRNGHRSNCHAPLSARQCCSFLSR